MSKLDSEYQGWLESLSCHESDPNVFLVCEDELCELTGIMEGKQNEIDKLKRAIKNTAIELDRLALSGVISRSKAAEIMGIYIDEFRKLSDDPEYKTVSDKLMLAYQGIANMRDELKKMTSGALGLEAEVARLRWFIVKMREEDQERVNGIILSQGIPRYCQEHAMIDRCVVIPVEETAPYLRVQAIDKLLASKAPEMKLLQVVIDAYNLMVSEDPSLHGKMHPLEVALDNSVWALGEIGNLIEGIQKCS